MDRFEEVAAEAEGLPSPGIEREAEIAKLAIAQRIESSTFIHHAREGRDVTEIERDLMNYHGITVSG